MCYNYQISKSGKIIEQKFKRRFEQPEAFEPRTKITGFAHPFLPVITNKQPDEILLYKWGLIPHWAKDAGISKQTLNARIETLKEKPSFRSYTANRCLIIADGFTEWKWLDEKGKQKQPYLIGLPTNDCFAFAGLFATWQNPATGLPVHTYTIITTEANELMAEIHNTAKRMPVILKPEEENEYLNGLDFKEITDRTDFELVATPS